ncbi:MAG TPA: 8-amino-7-oxononanoate synthase [Steroidobacteraceae bacterium]|nr:8-amino-7-oxononanoate synthase [Steroidobacteraceae bacterium]
MRLQNELASLEEKKRKRTLLLPRGIDFTSNDYLGLTYSGEIRERIARKISESSIPLGAGGSRLLRGNHTWHEQVEEDFRKFEAAEAALYFTSGYAANMAVLTALPTRHDVILFDERVHASLREGIHASFASKKSFEHNSLESLNASASSMTRAGDVFVVIESLYSMDGDEAPIKEIASFCSENGFILIVDEAHATGLFGTNGRGLIDENGVRDHVYLSIHPCGKALAGAGAFVCSSETVKSYLINRARTMIFTTALPPVIPMQISEVLNEITAHPELRDRVFSNAGFVRKTLQGNLKRWKIHDGRSPIISLIIGADAEACRVADALAERGVDVRPIRPPTVAEGTSRFRLTVNALHAQAELELLCNSLIEIEKQFID